jgi:hypothetical protein
MWEQFPFFGTKIFKQLSFYVALLNSRSFNSLHERTRREAQSAHDDHGVTFNAP